MADVMRPNLGLPEDSVVQEWVYEPPTEIIAPTKYYPRFPVIGGKKRVKRDAKHFVKKNRYSDAIYAKESTGFSGVESYSLAVELGDDWHDDLADFADIWEKTYLWDVLGTYPPEEKWQRRLSALHIK